MANVICRCICAGRLTEQYNGEGIRHIALYSDDLIKAPEQLQEAGVPMMAAPPGTCYDMLDS